MRFSQTIDNSRQYHVYLVDDNPIFLNAAVNFLKRKRNFAVVGTSLSVENALEQVQNIQPDIILLDLDMPDITGYAAIPLFQKIVPCSKIIILTLFESQHNKALASAAGADGFVPKSSMYTDLLPSIFRVYGFEVNVNN